MVSLRVFDSPPMGREFLIKELESDELIKLIVIWGCLYL